MPHALTKDDGAYPLYGTDENDKPDGTGVVTTLRFGMRWEPVKGERKGILGKAERKLWEQQGLTDPADWDAGAVFLTGGDPKKVIGFGNQDPFKDESTNEEKLSARHSGDSIRGVGDGDDESVDLDLPHIPKRYDEILLVGGAFKKGSKFQGVKDVKATVYDGTGGTFTAVGEFEPSLLGEKRLIAVARITRDRQTGLWSLSIVNQSYDVEEGNLPSLLRGAMRLQ